MGKKITQYPNNVSTNPDNLSLLDLSEKTGASTFESRKWNLTAFKAWVNSWVVAGVVAWNDITGKPTTLSGYGITDAIDGNGTNNYVAKFTPDGNTIGNSQIQDDGNLVGLVNAPNILGKISAISSDEDTVFWLQNTKNGGNNTGLFALTNGTGSVTNIGVSGKAGGGTTSNYGVSGLAISAGLINYGIFGQATGGTTNIGVRAYVDDGANNYVAWLQKAPENQQNSLGKFLKSITGDGKANWANITASDVQGAVGAVNGTNNYIAKFTPDGNTIGNSQIQDDGANVTIGAPTDVDSLVTVNTQTLSNALFSSSKKTTGTNRGLYGEAIGNGASFNYGLHSYATGANLNIGVNTKALGTGTVIGIKAEAQGTGSKYSIQLQDGTEAEGKFLKSVTVEGRANWATITASDISGVVDTTGGTANYISKFTDANTIEESLIIDDGTNIGIGTATPSAKLHINNTGSSESFRVEDETSVDSTPFIIDSAGNVGIGDFAPFTKLTVNGTSAILGTVNSNEGSLYIDHAGVSAWKIGVTSTNTSTFHIGNGTAFANKILNITNDEKVGVGITSPSTKLDVNGDLKISTIDNATTDTDKFLVSDSGVVKYRTGAELLSDINGASKDLTLDRKTASYTLVASDNNKLIEMNVASANNVTIDNSVFSAGNQILVSQYGAGQVTFVAGAGVTLRSPSGKLKLTGQYSLATIIAISATEFYISGDLTA